MRSHPGAMGTSMRTAELSSTEEPSLPGATISTIAPSGSPRPIGSRKPAIAESPMTLGSANVT